MKIRNGHDEITLTRDNISMTSTDKHTIKLQYTGKLNGDMLYEAFNAALGACFDKQDNITIDSPNAFENVVESVSAFIVPRISPRCYGVVIELVITATNGKTITKKLVVDVESVELTALMEGFMHDGSGIDQANREHIKSQYERWWELVTA